jgi:hypothetical protein
LDYASREKPTRKVKIPLVVNLESIIYWLIQRL